MPMPNATGESKSKGRFVVRYADLPSRDASVDGRTQIVAHFVVERENDMVSKHDLYVGGYSHNDIERIVGRVPEVADELCRYMAEQLSSEENWLGKYALHPALN